MTFASDQQSSTAVLSATSRRMLALRDTVLGEWEAKVRLLLEQAKNLRHPVIINTIPFFYEDL
ncbi:MAG TPA: hypothetical protein VIT92_01990, partial [Burkholderiaceae bacterium]